LLLEYQKKSARTLKGYRRLASHRPAWKLHVATHPQDRTKKWGGALKVYVQEGEKGDP